MDHRLSPIAIADDGELQDVRRLLQRLDLRFVDAWQGQVPPDALRISNPRHALEAAADKTDERPFHIVVLDEESAPLRRELRGGPFDFIVQQPVHPAALRLLILHALYSGPERRTSTRVAMDAEVKLGGLLRRRTARLTQLSDKGCGLVGAKRFEVGESTAVVFPRDLTGARALSLEGRVVATVDGETGEGCEASIAFRPPNAEVREQLRSLMATHGVGSAALHPRRRKRPECGEPSKAPSATSSSPEERRCSPRKTYCRPVLASAKGGVHTIIGRDLSTGGMRVAPDARLAIGDCFKLVVYGSAGRAPLLVKAVVTRDDGDEGCVLQFRDVGSSAAAWLEDAVGSLPRFASGERSPHVVVSEIIEGG